jgi:hypothetical protein
MGDRLEAASHPQDIGDVENPTLSEKPPDNQADVDNYNKDEVSQQSVGPSPKSSYRRHRRSRVYLDTEVSDNTLSKIQRGSDQTLNESKDFDDPNDLSILNWHFELLKERFNKVPEIHLNGRPKTMSSFMDNSPNPNIMGSMSRQSQSPSTPMTQVNGGGPMAGAMANGVPMSAGHQMDLNHLYEMVVELSDVLKQNREMTRGIITSAEDIMVCASLSSSTINQTNLLI